MTKAITYAELVGGVQKDLSRVGKVSTESVHKHTGKHWKEWIAILEKAGARKWTFQQICGFLKRTYKMTPWWQQGVAMGFEIATGKRREGTDAKGNYGITATKSLKIPGPRAWKILVSEKGMSIWLKPLSLFKLKPKAQFETRDGFFGEIRTVNAPRRARLYWQDPTWEKHTVVEIGVYAPSDKGCVLAVNHTGIKSAEIRNMLRARWRDALEELVKGFAPKGNPKRIPKVDGHLGG